MTAGSVIPPSNHRAAGDDYPAPAYAWAIITASTSFTPSTGNTMLHGSKVHLLGLSGCGSVSEDDDVVGQEGDGHIGEEHRVGVQNRCCGSGGRAIPEGEHRVVRHVAATGRQAGVHAFVEQGGGRLVDVVVHHEHPLAEFPFKVAPLEAV